MANCEINEARFVGPIVIEPTPAPLTSFASTSPFISTSTRIESARSQVAARCIAVPPCAETTAPTKTRRDQIIESPGPSHAYSHTDIH